MCLATKGAGALKLVVCAVLALCVLAGCGWHDEQVPRCDGSGWETVRHKHNYGMSDYSEHYERAHEPESWCAVLDGDGDVVLVAREQYAGLEQVRNTPTTDSLSPRSDRLFTDSKGE